MRSWCAHSLSAPLTLSLSVRPYPLPKFATAAHYCCFHYGFPIKSRKAPCAISIRCCASDENKIWQAAEPEVDNFVVVNFYLFVFIKDPQHEIAKHLAFLKGLDIHGRIYINEQGINAQYSGPSRDAFAYVEWLKEDEKFYDIVVQTSPAFHGHAFPKLKLRYKPSLVQFEGGISHLPLLDPSMRAKAIAPSEWRKRLEAVNNNDDASDSNPNTNYILLDVRNGYEWDIGHFHGAQRPDVDCFRSTSFGLSPTKATGFSNLYTLEGGVSHYLKTEGPVKWIGNLFTFDSRLSLPPSAYNHEMMIEAGMTQQAFESNKFAKCYICGSQVSELRHRNCANLDCNFLFLCCANCVMDLRGCCCYNCMIAPRRRPVLPGFQRYKKWHVYRDLQVEA